MSNLKRGLKIKGLKHLIIGCSMLLCGIIGFAQKTPSFKETLSLYTVKNPQISPNGAHVLFEKQTTDWESNRFVTELWLSKNGNTPFQLTSNPNKGSRNGQWSPDGKWIAFLAHKKGKKQIHIISTEGNETFQLTHSKKNIERFSWSPNGKKIMFAQWRGNTEERKQRAKRYGNVIDSEDVLNIMQLWIMDFEPEHLVHQQSEDKKNKEFKPTQLLKDYDFHVNVGIWSPDGKSILVGHQPDLFINTFVKADISIVDVASGQLKTIVKNSSFDGPIAWSPDGKSFLYSSHVDNHKTQYYANSRCFITSTDGSKTRELATTFDEQLDRFTWNKNGIFALGFNKTKRRVYRIDPISGKVEKALNYPDRIHDFKFSKDGNHIVFTGATDTSLTEVYSGDFSKGNPTIISNSSSQIKTWNTIKHDIVSWTSTDGQRIEGVLQKPADFDAKKKYPLLVIIHGGPIGVSTPSQFKSYIYPTAQWLDKGALIFRPNYRGSAGYGEKFRGLNMKNWGIGSSEDILSGIDYLKSLGNIKEDKIAVMGSSFGGYLSAVLITKSNQFSAAAVGSGLTDLTTFYATTDIFPWIKQYMGGTPWERAQAYDLSSPMSAISKIKTPTLIQHGKRDGRVPVTNAYQLYRGLKDYNVPTKLIVYPDFGHRIRNPKEQLFAMWNNWQWFGKYIWDEDIKIPITD